MGDGVDTALAALYPERETVVPHDKPRKGVLTDKEKETNRLIVKVPITVETVIR